MFKSIPLPTLRLYLSPCLSCGLPASLQRFYNLDAKYSDEEKDKIIHTLNESDKIILSKYDITKGRIKQFSQWRSNNGILKTLSDIELVEGFSEKTAKKLFDSILKGPVEKETNVSNKIKGQILQPNLSPADIKNINSILAVYVTVNSVSWTLIDKDKYEIMNWTYHGIDYPEEKKIQITDILDLAWDITHRLPTADIYVMKAEMTTLRAAGSDPNNPKVLAVNLQKAQLVAMIIALINARDNVKDRSEDHSNSAKLKHRVYFLRPTLPYRLYGTLVGNERVSTDQTVEMLLQTSPPSSKTHVTVPDRFKVMFRSRKDLQKDMLGHCLLLGLTFMDLCIYKNQEKIVKLLQKRD